MLSGYLFLLRFQGGEFLRNLPELLCQSFNFSGNVLLFLFCFFILPEQFFLLNTITLYTAVTTPDLLLQTLAVRPVKFHLLLCLGNLQNPLILLSFQSTYLFLQKSNLFLQTLHGVAVFLVYLFVAQLTFRQHLFLCPDLKELILQRFVVVLETLNTLFQLFFFFQKIRNLVAEIVKSKLQGGNIVLSFLQTALIGCLLLLKLCKLLPDLTAGCFCLRHLLPAFLHLSSSSQQIAGMAVGTAGDGTAGIQQLAADGDNPETVIISSG